MPTVGLSMIVRNEERDLRFCLESVRGLVDEIVVVDTGSTDGTIDIAREAGARVVSYAWNHHYAEARNFGIQHNTTDWILVLDADEELSVEARERIPALLNAPEDVGGYLFSQRHYLRNRFVHANGRLSRAYDGDHPRAATAQAYLDNTLCRLFRRSPRIRYLGRIHEVADYDIKAAKLKLIPTDGVIHHFGKLLEDGADLDKHTRYRDLLRLAVEESPTNSNMWCQLALTESLYFDNDDEALRCYLRAREIRPGHPDALTEGARIYMKRGEHEKCIEMAMHLPDTGDQGILKYTLLGDASHDLGRLEQARSYYQQAGKLSRKSRDTSATGRQSVVTSKIGYVEVRMGMVRNGLQKLQRAAREHPRHFELHDRWVKGLLTANRQREAAEVAESMCRWILSEKIVAKAATLWIVLGEMERAKSVLGIGLRFFPESPLLRKLAGEAGLASSLATDTAVSPVSCSAAGI